MKRLMLCLTLALVSCDKPAPATPEAGEAPPATTAATPSEPATTGEKPAEPSAPLKVSDAFKLTDAHKGIVNDHTIDIKGGKLEGQLRFDDENGDNLVAIWSNEDLDLFAAHIVLGEDARLDRELRSLKQLRGDCEFDYSAAFIPSALKAMDLDKDGYGEITIAYKYACRSDLSPEDYKVLVLENGEKHALRGAEIIVLQGEEPYGDGKHEVEGFEDEPKALEHAKAVWKQHLVKQY